MISVVIPTHNRADLLERAVKSVKEQTIRDLEIIVISDGSTDDTDLVVNKMMEQDDRIHFITYKTPQGANTARNKGIEAASHDYIAFLDDDDEWLPTKLEKQLNVFQSNKDIGLVYTGSNLIYVHEETAYDNIPSESGDLAHKILFKNSIGTTSTVMVKKEILEKSGYFDTELAALQDYDLWIRVSQLTQIGVVEEPCINYYNYTGKKQISQQTSKYISAIEYIENKHRELFSTLSEKETKVRKSNFYMLLANKAMRNNSKKEAVRFSVKAFSLKPAVKGSAFIVLSLFKYKTVLKFRKKLKA
ncbi:glycosyltransferase family A protein [Alkalibacterium sp. 20]|uniref:glycosyltransferase family 2 protein n=1 Tax=Alkalibacterium sp. 20 TaxID=1798803 RepID=UPI00090023D1|nr:glycosyltransferase family A protein [Alkalibacterium sp. 20]OJF90672.1 hypothetical protein AX762_11635 [Alkalibacterium sp. 20]